MIQAFLSLGSNMGDRELNIKKAVEELQTIDGIEIMMVSSYFETEAEADKDQPKYINAAVEIMTTLEPRALLEITQEIEKKLGRLTKGDYGPRPIDIDISLFGDDLIIDEDLTIPHPLMHERLFVLEPLYEIAPELTHPVLGQSIQDLLLEIKGGYANYN